VKQVAWLNRQSAFTLALRASMIQKTGQWIVWRAATVPAMSARYPRNRAKAFALTSLDPKLDFETSLCKEKPLRGDRSTERRPNPN